MTAIRQRRLKLTVQLGTGIGTNQPNTFAGTSSDTATLPDLRATARIQNSGWASGSTAQVEVWGLSTNLMNQLATLGLSINLLPRNTLTIQAGDDQSGMSTVFSGLIIAAYADYNSSPDVPFHFECNSVADSVAPALATSFTGSTDVATIMAGFARQRGMGFENNGVNIQLRNPYFSGSLKTQTDTCADHAGIWAQVVTGNVLAIWPKGGSRKTPSIPIISAETGMKGYPSFTQTGIIVNTIYNPKIAYGGLVQVESFVLTGATQSKSANPSAVLPANGQWSVYKLDHILESQVPRGNWLSTIYAYNPRNAKPVLPGAKG